MFEGAFLRRHYPLYGNACAVVRWMLNRSAVDEAGDSVIHLDESCNAEDINMSIIFLPVSLLGLSLSLLSAHIFIRQRQRTSFRVSLVALSVATSGYMLFSSMDFVNVLLGGCRYWREPSRHLQVLIGAIVCVMGDSLLCLRNWCNLLMTAQRMEALLFPLRVEKLLRRKNFITALSLLLLLFLPMSLVRSFAEYLVVCSDAEESYALVGFPAGDDAETQFASLKPHYSLLLLHSWFDPYEAYVFFAVQTLVPVTLVLAFSLGMSIAMLNSRDNSTTTNAGESSSAVSNSLSKRNKARASRTVLCLAFKFCALQMPSYLGQLLTSPALNIELDIKRCQFVAELCLLLDSIFSMFVYAYFVPEFKAFFVALHRWVTCRPPALTRGFAAASSDLSRRVAHAVESLAEIRALRLVTDDA